MQTLTSASISRELSAGGQCHENGENDLKIVQSDPVALNVVISRQEWEKEVKNNKVTVYV